MPAEPWRGPSESWKAHARPLAQKALKEARAAGWFLRRATSPSAHIWGQLTCGDPSDPTKQRCTIGVLGTSGPPDGSATAIFIRAEMKKCPHPRDQSGASALDEAESLLDRAERCLGVVDKLLEAGRHGELIEDYFNAALSHAEAADAALERGALDDAETAERAQRTATEQAEDLAAGEVAPLTAARALDRARELVAGAEERLPSDKERRTRQVRARADELRSRITLARRLLGNG